MIEFQNYVHGVIFFIVKQRLHMNIYNIYFCVLIYLLHIMYNILNQFKSVLCSFKVVFVNYLACLKFISIHGKRKYK